VTGATAPRCDLRTRSRYAVPASLAVLALLALLGYAVLSVGGDRSLDRAVAAGQRRPAPPMSLSALGGPGKRSLDDYRGKVVVVNFWASWCPPCREEAPLLESWQRQLEAQGGTVVGVDVLDVTGDALSFAHRSGITYPLVRDRDGSSARDFGVAGYPETVVIDRRGRVAAVQRGPVDQQFFAKTLAPLLRERS
jgi:cytochrome c biogenesis protein CcmG, thiol:disulfide interchange protein DsbE